MRIRLYGRLGDVIGREIELAAAETTVGDVRRSLAASHAAAAATLGRSRAIIAGCFVADDRTVGDAESIEFLPPVSGG